MMLSDLFIAPPIEELAEKYAGTNICLVAQGPTGHQSYKEYNPDSTGEKWHVWSQNGGWISHPYTDLAFMMDDLKGHVWDGLSNYSRDDVNEAVVAAKCPLITSKAYEDYPMLVEFPLEWALRVLPVINFSIQLNETINYMLALAILFKVARIDIYGADYHDSDGKPFRPDKRAGVTGWIHSAAMARKDLETGEGGIKIRTCDQSNIMRYSIQHPETELEGLYGYEINGFPSAAMDQIEIIGPGQARIKVGSNGKHPNS